MISAGQRAGGPGKAAGGLPPDMDPAAAGDELKEIARLARKGASAPDCGSRKTVAADGKNVEVQDCFVPSDTYTSQPFVWPAKYCKEAPDALTAVKGPGMICTMPSDREEVSPKAADGADGGKEPDASKAAPEPASQKHEMRWWDHGYHAVDLVASASILPVWSAITAIRDYKDEADQPGHTMDAWDHGYHIVDIGINIIPGWGQLWSVVTAGRDWYLDYDRSTEKTEDEKVKEGSPDAPKVAPLRRPGDAPAPSASGSAGSGLEAAAASALASASAPTPAKPPKTFEGKPIDPNSLTVLVEDGRGGEKVDDKYLEAQLRDQSWYKRQSVNVQKEIIDYAKEHAKAHGDGGQSVQWKMDDFYNACYDRIKGFNGADPGEGKRDGPRVLYSTASKEHKSGVLVQDKDKKPKENVGVDIPRVAAPSGGGGGAKPEKKGGGNPWSM